MILWFTPFEAGQAWAALGKSMLAVPTHLLVLHVFGHSFQEILVPLLSWKPRWGWLLCCSSDSPSSPCERDMWCLPYSRHQELPLSATTFWRWLRVTLQWHWPAPTAPLAPTASHPMNVLFAKVVAKSIFLSFRVLPHSCGLSQSLKSQEVYAQTLSVKAEAEKALRILSFLLSLTPQPHSVPVFLCFTFSDNML